MNRERATKTARTVRRLALGLLLTASAASAAGFDPAAVIAGLARIPPATIAFSEARFSPLLAEPLIVKGQLSYLGPGRFDREVTEPYHERTAIRGESVRVERDGEPARTFALKRSAELGALITSFAALLTGDAAAVARDFTVTASGGDASWKLDLVPLDSRERRRLREIVVSGANDEPRCFAVLTAQGGGSVMFLGEGADERIGPHTELASLVARCGSE